MVLIIDTVKKIIAKIVGYGGLVSLYFADCYCEYILILSIMFIVGNLMGGPSDSILNILFGFI